MENTFVSYLNSMNNAGSDTVAALAEAQVLNKYYSQIKIERKLGRYISDRIRSGEKDVYILTGHAGDGKTSILVQVLRDLDMLAPMEKIDVEKEYENDGIRLYSVKDMSELSSDKQLKYLTKALESPQNGMSSILISNTGPLLKCFEEIAANKAKESGEEFSECDRIDLQNKLLDQLDNNSSDHTNISGFDVMIINIARVDNVDFAAKVIDKILDDNMWSSCSECPKHDYCHIRQNVSVMQKYRDNISKFVTQFYRFLYENDKRMTIRQMLSQISFSITGNQNCSDIKSKSSDIIYKYLFPNLFFGYVGNDLNDDAMQIRGIALANELQLDAISLDVDYDLFVTGNLQNHLNADICSILSKRYDLYIKSHIFRQEDACSFEKTDVLFRKAIRRFYIVFNFAKDSAGINPVFDELFGKGFNSYIQLMNGTASPFVKKELNRVITRALYIDATGTLTDNPQGSLPLTVKRGDNVYQKVMIVDGMISNDQIRVETQKCWSEFEDFSAKNIVFIKVGTEEFRLTLPLFIYFEKIADGVISTNANPALTHGLSKLRAILREYVKRNSNDDNEFKVMLNKTSKPEYFNIQINGDKLIFD